MGKPPPCGKKKTYHWTTRSLVEVLNILVNELIFNDIQTMSISIGIGGRVVKPICASPSIRRIKKRSQRRHIIISHLMPPVATSPGAFPQLPVQFPKVALNVWDRRWVAGRHRQQRHAIESCWTMPGLCLKGLRNFHLPSFQAARYFNVMVNRHSCTNG